MIANRRRLEEELALVTLATNEKASAMEVKHVLLESTGKSLAISATDIDSSLFSSVALEDEGEPIRAFPPAKRLLSTIRSLTTETVDLRMRPNGKLGIKAGGHRSELPCLRPENFPRCAAEEPEVWAEVPADSLFALIRDGAFCLSPGHSPEAFEIRLEGDQIVVSSSDRNHVAIAAGKVETETPMPSISAMIGDFALPKVEAMASRAKTLRVGISPRQIQIRDETDRRLVCRRVEAVIPNLLEFLERFKKFPVTVSVDRLDILAAMKRLSGFSEAAHYQEIEVAIGSELKLTAGDADHGLASENIESASDFAGEGTFVLRHDKLLAAFRHGRGERMVIKNGPGENSNPVLICNDDPNGTYGTWGWMAGSIHRKKVPS